MLQLQAVIEGELALQPCFKCSFGVRGLLTASVHTDPERTRGSGSLHSQARMGPDLKTMQQVSTHHSILMPIPPSYLKALQIPQVALLS